MLTAFIQWFRSTIAATLHPLPGRPAPEPVVSSASEEERYRVISAMTSDYTFSTSLDANGVMTLNWVGGAFETITGYTYAEYKAHGGWLAHVYPEDLPKDYQALAILQTNQPVKHDIRVLTKARHLRWMRVYAHPIWDATTERLVGIIGAVQDITEQKRVEAELQKSASRGELLLAIDRALLAAQSPEQIAQEALSRIRRLIPSQRVSITLFNFDQNEATFLAASFDEGYHPAGVECITLDEYGRAIIETLQQGMAYRVDDVLTDPHATDLDRMLASRGMRSWLYLPLHTHGRLTGALNLARGAGNPFTDEEAAIGQEVASQIAIVLQQQQLLDVLQNEVAENAILIANLQTLRKSAAIVASTLNPTETAEQILEQIARVVPYDSASIQLLDGDALEIIGGRELPGNATMFGTRFPISDNEAALPILRGEQPYILHNDIQPISVAFHELPHTYVRAWLAVPLRLKGRIIGIISLDSRQVGLFTHRHAELVLTFADQVAVALEHARLFTGIQTELAERIRAERKLEALVAELEDRNAELERFTYTVSHDLKSPLVTIASFAGFLEHDARSGDQERLLNDIHRIGAAAGRMHRLLDDLLELSRIGRMVNPPERVPFATIVQEALELVHGTLHERGVVVQVAPGLPIIYGDRTRLVEVLQNLLQNAAKFMGQQPEPLIEISAQPRADEIVFVVRDNGIGIDPAYHQRIFGLFDKLDPRSQGTGIGLALVKRIIEVHGGRIWVESGGLGHGTAFCFTLPHAEEPPTPGDL